MIKQRKLLDWRVYDQWTLEQFINKVRDNAQHKVVNYSWTIGKNRTKLQNKTLHRVYRIIADAKHGGDIDFVRRECKFNFGFPIIKHDKPDALEDFDYLVETYNITYEDQLKLTDRYPVTSIMTTAQCSRYIDLLIKIYSGSEQGVDMSIVFGWEAGY